MVPELVPEPDNVPLALPVELPEVVPVPPTAPDVAPVPPAPEAPALDPADVPLPVVMAVLPDEPVVADPLLAPVVADPLVPPGGFVEPQPAKERPTTRAATLHFENVRMNCSCACLADRSVGRSSFMNRDV